MKINDIKSLKYAFCLALALFAAQAASAGIYQHGTVVRMRMADCLPNRHGFMVAFGGQATQASPEVCPEYTLVSEKVVFVIVGRSSDQLIPLADIVDFRFRNNDMEVRIDDARHENRFNIKEMVLRTEWDRMQKHIADELNNPMRAIDGSIAMRTQE